MDDLINRQLGQYRLIEVIRRGGMSTVYKAYQESLDRYVAVKVLFHGQNPQFVARFQREARAIAHLQHPNILPIFDYGEQDGLLYLVLQYIEQGMTLGDLLGHPMEPVPALQLMGRVLAALDYAHERGIVHRDVKPANILMPTPSWPMLSDFGIVKLLADNENSNLTAQGMIIGTPAYLAPEQVLGMHIDRRTDLYSAGIVFYEMVTGRVPFDTGTPIVVATKQAYEPPPPPLVLNPDLPKAIELVVMRALEKDPANRYQTAAEMAAALERVAQQLERPPAPGGAPGRAQAEAPVEDLDAQYMAGIAAFEAGQWDQAAQRLRKVVAADPTYADAATMLEAAQEAQAQQSGPPPPAPPRPIAPLPVPPIAAAPPPAPPAPGMLAAQAGPPVAPRAASETRPAAEAVALPAPPVAPPPTPTTTTTRRARQRRSTPLPGEITVAPAAASTGAAHRTEQEAAPPPAPEGAAPAAVPFSASAPPAVPAVPATATPAATPPADATPAGSTTTARRTRRRATPAEIPAAVETEQPAPAPPTDTTKTRPKTSTARRSSRTAADTAPPPAAPPAAAAAATALPDAGVVRSAPPAPPPAAAAPPPAAREIAAAPLPPAAAVPVAPLPPAAAVPVAPGPPAPPAAPSGGQNLRPVPQRRSPVPFVAVGAGVLLLILAAIFGPGLLAGRSANGGSPTPAATAPATAAAAPSATSGLPLGAVTGSETPGVASPTPAQVAAGEPTVAATEPPSAIPATAAPTEAATAVMDMPTPAAIPPTTNEGAVGVVRFTDDGQHVVDQVVVSMTLSTASTPPAGQGRVAWLVNSTTGASLNLGRITPNAQGAWTQTYTDTQQANLLANYDGFLVTNEALDTTPFAPSSDVVWRGQLPVQALVHIAHLLVSYPDTPNQVALEVGLRAQVSALVTHAQQLSTAQATGNFTNVKREAEAIANLVVGAKSTDFGDLNKDGLIQTAGDGFGLLPNSPQDGYLLGVKDHAELSAAAADATGNVKQHAAGVAVTTDNVQIWATQIRDKARAITSAPDVATTRPLVADILGLATYIEQGQAIGTDGNILPVKGSGGAITSYQEALHMADMPIQPAK